MAIDEMSNVAATDQELARSQIRYRWWVGFVRAVSAVTIGSGGFVVTRFSLVDG